MRATWYVLEDGSTVDPSDVAPDDAGILRHKDGAAVAMRGQTHSSRGVDLDEEGKMIDSKQMRPGQSGAGYLDRQMQAGAAGSLDHDKNGQPGGSSKPADAAGDIAALRAEYQTALGKKPFPGWDADTLREKIAAKPKAD